MANHDRTHSGYRVRCSCCQQLYSREESVPVRIERVRHQGLPFSGGWWNREHAARAGVLPTPVNRQPAPDRR